MTYPIILNYNKTQPFLKWVGGKRALLPQLLHKIPNNFNNYFEPFIGGGALFFELFNQGKLKDKKIYLFDINSELINAYNVVKRQPQELIKELEVFKQKHNKEFYYEIRSWDREKNFIHRSEIQRASRFIYLNKTCFNGLYRVNKNNQNNVPMGKYVNPNICDKETILNASFALQNVNIEVADFSKVLDYVKKDDFIYLDPPYYPLTPTASFTTYNKDMFLDDEQKRLCEVFKELHKRDAFVMHSNSDTLFIKELYSDFEIDFVECARFINSKSNGRGKIKEVLVRSKKW
jgi:DNA adenine methylase